MSQRGKRVPVKHTCWLAPPWEFRELGWGDLNPGKPFGWHPSAPLRLHVSRFHHNIQVGLLPLTGPQHLSHHTGQKHRPQWSNCVIYKPQAQSTYREASLLSKWGMKAFQKILKWHRKAPVWGWGSGGREELIYSSCRACGELRQFLVHSLNTPPHLCRLDPIHWPLHLSTVFNAFLPSHSKPPPNACLTTHPSAFAARQVIWAHFAAAHGTDRLIKLCDSLHSHLQRTWPGFICVTRSSSILHFSISSCKIIPVFNILNRGWE